MARRNLKATVGASLGEGQFVISAGNTASQDLTTITAHVATAVAGGAGDVSATVTLISADVTALTNALAGDVVLSFDTTNVNTFNKLKRAVDALLLLAQSSGMV